MTEMNAYVPYTIHANRYLWIRRFEEYAASQIPTIINIQN